MPAYDCGAPECEECQKAFGPDRRKAIAEYERRERFYASLAAKTHQETFPRAGDVFTSDEFYRSTQQ